MAILHNETSIMDFTVIGFKWIMLMTLRMISHTVNHDNGRIDVSCLR